MNLNKSLNEKQRISTESTRPSFSSSCSSSLSSLDCNKTAQPEESSFDRIIFPEIPSRDAVLTQPCTSPHLGQQSLDLQDVVKDSMYREAGGLSVKTSTKEEAVAHAVKHKDSPRPLQLSKYVDRSYGIGNKGKQILLLISRSPLEFLLNFKKHHDSASTSSSQSDLIKSFPVDHNDSFSTSSKGNDLKMEIRIPKSPRCSSKELISPRQKNPDLIMKPISRLPIESAPWKQPKGSQASQKLAKISAEIPNPFLTVTVRSKRD
ncbi:hypothetical protein GH714_043846 [Hevea brasiliensis]|uniref:DUF3741 domain-containing protein n=1 Tax=Hevea brasiliensis TaxID=3981 RepID=A0A6A6K0X7_HEVBR|nr:hypothetical protein GH714_043846 [Hevea brasiliensis]